MNKILLCWLLLAGFNTIATEHQSVEELPRVNINDVASGQLLFITDKGSYVAAPQLNTDVSIDISGMVAKVRVKQVFTNVTNEWLHAKYVFPLPDEAAVNGFKFSLEGKEVIAEIKRKDKAKAEFDAAKKSGRKAALLEQLRANLFTTNLANIAPESSVTVVIDYFQSATVDSHKFSLDFPLTVTPRYRPPRYQPGNEQNPEPSEMQFIKAEQDSSAVGKVNLMVNLDAGSGLELVKSKNHSMMIKEISNSQYQLELFDHQPDKDFVLSWQYKLDQQPKVVHLNQAFQNEHYGLIMMLPALPEIQPSLTDRPRELIFILDTSGSMYGDSFKQAKQALYFALDTLNEADSFQLIHFNTSAKSLFHQPVQASAKNIQRAIKSIEQLEADGGTEIALALEQLFSVVNSNERLQQVVFLTDGAVGNEAGLLSLIAEQLGSKRLFTVGLGSAPNRFFMSRAAEIGGGTSHIINSSNELLEKMQNLFKKLSQPQLTNMEFIDYSNGIEFASGVRDLYSGEPLLLSYKSATEEVSGEFSGLFGGRDWHQELPVVAPYDEANGQSETIPPLALLWARKRIRADYSSYMLTRDTIYKDAVTEKALAFSLASAFTSFIAVEKHNSRPAELVAKSSQLPNALPAGQHLPQTSLHIGQSLKVSVLLLLLALSLIFTPLIATFLNQRTAHEISF